LKMLVKFCLSISLGPYRRNTNFVVHDWETNLITSAKAGSCDQVGLFVIRSVCPSVCLSFCVSLCRITAKVISRFHGNLVLWFLFLVIFVVCSGQNKEKLVHTAQTSAKAPNVTKSHPELESRFTDSPGFESGCLPDRSQNVADSLSCQRQSFYRVSWKSAGDRMRK